MLGWPWDNKKDKEIEELTEQNVTYRLRIDDLKNTILRLNTFIDINQKEVDKAKNIISTIYNIRDLVKEYFIKSSNDRLLSNKTQEELEKENRYLKANIKSLQNRLKTFTAGIEHRQTYEVVEELRGKIDKFLQDEDQLFVKNVKDKLVKADYFDKFATANSITLNKDIEFSLDIIRDITNSYGDKDGSKFLEAHKKLALELYSRAMYKPFVKRSIAMNNKTKELLTEIMDTIFLLDDAITNELVNLRLENKRLKEVVLEMTSKDDKAKLIHDLQQEIARLKVENEALRYMK